MHSIRLTFVLGIFALTAIPAQAAQVCEAEVQKLERAFNVKFPNSPPSYWETYKKQAKLDNSESFAKSLSAEELRHRIAMYTQLRKVAKDVLTAAEAEHRLCLVQHAQSLATSKRNSTSETAISTPTPTNAKLPSATKPAPATAASSKKQKRQHVPDAVATQCLSLSNKPGYGGFVNSCNYTVFRTYCAYRPKKDAWVSALDCEKGQFGSDVIGANKTNAAHTKGAERIHWVACKYKEPNGTYAGINLTDVKWDAQKRALTFRCSE